MLINYNGVPCPKADTLLRFAEPEVVLGQGTPFYCRFELDNPLTYIFSNIRRMGPSGKNLGCMAPMRRCAPLLAHTLRRPCGGRRPESDPACLSAIDYVNQFVQ